MKTSNQISTKKEPRGKFWLLVLAIVAGCLLGAWLVQHPWRNVDLTVQDPSAVSADLVIKNRNRGELEFGEEYLIERYDRGRWTSLEVREDRGFGLVGYSLLSGESRTLHLSWEGLYGPLEPGRYRVGKGFSLNGVHKVRYAEFSLEE